MAGLTILSFAAQSAGTAFWQSSNWLVSTVLPAVVVDLTNEEREENAAPELRRNRHTGCGGALESRAYGR